MSAPLLGHNLVRLLYLDETGTTRDATFLSVAGVIVHGDRQWPQVNERIAALIEKYVAAPRQTGFAFHATDIFHGKRYWHAIEQSTRLGVLLDMAAIIRDLRLPVVVGSYEKDPFGKGVLSAADHQRHEFKAAIIHNAAAIDCLRRADEWLERFAPRELATVIHEGGSRATSLIQRCVEVLRDEKLMDAEGFPDTARTELRLPLRRIIDTVHFATKSGARPLQLADLCAFLFGRFTQGKPIPQQPFDLIWEQVRWLMPSEAAVRKSLLAEAAKTGQLPG